MEDLGKKSIGRYGTAYGRELDGRRPVNPGIGIGGILVIGGIIIALFWSVILGVIVALVGLVAFGGFAKGRWY